MNRERRPQASRKRRLARLTLFGAAGALALAAPSFPGFVDLPKDDALRATARWTPSTAFSMSAWRSRYTSAQTALHDFVHRSDPTPPAPAQRDFIDTFIRQIALVLDRQRLREAEQAAKLVAGSERLSKTLLNSISHEMRTPITAIASAASSLSEGSGKGSPEFQQAMKKRNAIEGTQSELVRAHGARRARLMGTRFLV